MEARQASHDEAALYQGVVDNAAAVTGARYVNLSWLEADGYIRGSAWAFSDPGRFERALAAARRVVPGFDPITVRFRSDVNPAVRSVLVEGRPCFAPFTEHVRGTVHPAIARIASRVLGLAWTHSVPLRVAGSMAGALAFHWSERPDQRALRVAEAFSAQCALTLENARLSEALRARAADLERSRERIAAAEERVRREIADLLQGRVETRLLVAAHRLWECRDLLGRHPGQAASLLGAVIDDLERIREEDVRHASHRLHPSVIAVGLLPALQLLAEDLGPRLDVTVSASARVAELDHPAHNALSEQIRIGVYRVVEEALANVVRHAGAGAAVVEVAVENARSLVAAVRDAGRGFDPVAARDGPGLRGMRDRVELLGGSLDVESGPGSGTRVTARLPLGAGDGTPATVGLRAPEPAATALPSRSAHAALYQGIVENALVVTGAHFVSLSWYDPREQAQELGAVAPLPLLHRVLAAARAAVPAFDPARVRFSADANPATRAVLIEGRALLAPFMEHATGTLHPGVLRAAATVLGLRWTFSVPLWVHGTVAGALAFHFRARPAARDLPAAQAFAGHVSLTLANARLSDALRERAEEIQRSRERIVAADERVRREIAELLHGRVQTRLLVVTHRLWECRRMIAADPGRAATVLAGLGAELDRVREEDVRHASDQLHPSALGIGLLPALQLLVESVGPRLEVTLAPTDRIRDLDHPTQGALPAPVRLAVYRFVEEALGNVARHAGTDAARVEIDVDGRASLRAIVSDRGRGFDPDTVQVGVGLHSVRDRIERLGGTLVVSSSPDAGASLVVTLPLAGSG